MRLDLQQRAYVLGYRAARKQMTRELEEMILLV
jgi:hypothetical protein